jgi:hypothetical protein
MQSRYIKEAYEMILCYKERTYGGEISPGQEGDSWPSHEDEIIEIDLLSLHRPDSKSKKLSYDRETVYADFNPSKVDQAYLVMVRYSDGDTFGHSSGHMYVEGVYKSKKKADKVAKSIEKDTYKGYKAWSSYFGGLESVEVVNMSVED